LDGFDDKEASIEECISAILSTKEGVSSPDPKRNKTIE
jgi:hypothetical protein